MFKVLKISRQAMIFPNFPNFSTSSRIPILRFPAHAIAFPAAKSLARTARAACIEARMPRPAPAVRQFLRAALPVLAALFFCQCEKRAETPADFIFINGAEVGSIDPSQVSAQTDGRVVTSLFEGLMRYNPAGRAEPGVSLEPVVSPDGKTWTFPFREGVRWSDGSPVTARDFLLSWKRFLEPATAADYVSIFDCVKNAAAYSGGKLTDFAQVGIKAPDDRTLVVTLENPVPYFKDLVAFMAFCPINPAARDRLGSAYFKPGTLVGNGPYLLREWRLNDRIRLEKNPLYWDAANVKLAAIDVLPVGNPSTALNLFLTHEADLMMDKGLIPSSLADALVKQPYFHRKPFLATWFIRFNSTRAPYNDPRVRKALSLCIDRERIVTAATRLGEPTARSITPPGTGDGYQPPLGPGLDVAEARRLLAEAGFPGGKGFPVLDFLYPSKFDTDRDIAIQLQGMWQSGLGITVSLPQQEYKVYLDAQKKMDYAVSRSSWVGDYNDPNTFLDLFTSANGNNRTGWANADYDALITAAAAEADPVKRYAQLHAAEQKLIVDDCVIAPVYHYVGVQFYRPEELGGVEANLTDEHPLRAMFWKEKPAGRGAAR